MVEGLTPSNCDLFYVYYGVVLPECIIGLIVNGLFLLSFNRHRQETLSARIDRIAASLITLCFLWSLICSVKYILKLFTMPASSLQVEAFLNYSFMIAVFCMNWALAIERNTVIRAAPHSPSRTVWVGLLGMALVLVNLFVFATSPTNDATIPLYTTQAIVWVAAMATGFVVLIGNVVYLYVSTFRHCSKSFKTFSTPIKETEIMLMERRVMINCVIMSSTLFVAYLPGLMFILLKIVAHVDNSGLQGASYILISSDLIGTPLLISFFMPHIRRAVGVDLGLFSKDSIIYPQQVLVDFEMHVNEASNDPNTPRKFHVVRVIE